MIKRVLLNQKGLLRTLSLSANSFTVGNAQGMFVGNVMNTAPGSMVVISALSVANSLQLVKVAGVWKIQVGSAAPGSPGTLTFNLIESLQGASNTPHTSAISVLENAAGAGTLDFSQASDSALFAAVAA